MPPHTLLLDVISDSPPMIWQVGLVLAVVIGIVLWLLGRRVVRPAYAVCGLVLGGIVALAVSREVNSGGTVIPWIVLGAVTGCLLSFLMFRIWMGLSFATMLALIAPCAHIVWEGITPPTSSPSVLTESSENQISENQHLLQSQIIEAYEKQKAIVQKWWTNLEKTTQHTLALAAGGGGLIGLIAGLIYPYQIASCQSALVGAMLFMTALRGLLVINAPWLSQWLPQNPRASLILLGLITISGALVQWTILKPKTDR